MKHVLIQERKSLFLFLRYLLLLFVMPTELIAQSITISGTVTDSNKEAVIGANVLLKGTSTGTITDVEGKYQLTVPENGTLVFSSVGYTSQEIAVNKRRIINVTLSDDIMLIDEVVVVGYGVQKKKLVTGATVQVKGDNIAKLNTNNPLQAMQGQTPGVNIASTSGQPGADMKVTIRGLGTVGNSQPLYLIDGVGGDISTLNPADIESIDVLKDAASAAIYGAQAANGVVLITTKQGKEGKAQISFDAYYGIQNVPRTANMLNAEQYMVIMNEQAVNSGNAPYDWSQIKSIYDANGNVYDSNWVDAMFKDNATTESYSLGVTGGSATSTYALSLGYLNQEGIVGGSDVSNYTRYNFRINSEHKLFKDLLTVGEQVSFVYKKNNGVGVGNQYNNTLRGAFGTSPITPIYSDNNNYDSPYNDTTNSDWYKGDGNPYGAMMTNTNNENKNATFSGNVYAELRPIKNLKIRTTFGAVYGSSEYRSFKPLYRFSIYDYNETRTSVSQNMNHSLGMTWTNTATYDWKIKDHAFNALIGMEAYRYEGTYLSGGNGALKEGFDDWEHAYVSNGTASSSTDGLSASGNPHDEGRSVSYFARLGWNWKETYMINATLRSDGSSKFASGNRFGYFPSVSAGWTISNEKFMESTQGWLDFLKIRASWGQVGNQNIKNYQYLAPIKNTNTHYLFGSGFSDAGAAAQLATNWGAFPSRLSNPNLTWETSEQTNIGLDFGFLNNTIYGELDWYSKDTKDILLALGIPHFIGLDAPEQNAGVVRNSGVEAMVGFRKTFGEFTFNTSFNLAYNKNEWIDRGGDDKNISGYNIQTIGSPLNAFYIYQADGLIANEQELEEYRAKYKSDPRGMSDLHAGDVKLVDTNNDGTIDPDDRQIFASNIPKFTYGWNISGEYKGFDLSLLFQGSSGANRMMYGEWIEGPSYEAFTGVHFRDRWTEENQNGNAEMPRLEAANNRNASTYNSFFLKKTNYLRLKNAQLGYTFSKDIRDKLRITKLRLYVSGSNLLTFSSLYQGLDPEGKSDRINDFPPLKIVNFGVNIIF